MRKMLILIIVGCMSFNSLVYAGKVISLAPSESKSLTNHFGWTLHATCNIQGGLKKSKILVSVVEKTGQVNGKNLSKGQATAVHVKANDNISVTAESGATVNLVNLSANPVQAVCNT